VLSLQHYPHALWLEMTVQAIGDLLSQPFLDLQATGESLNYASELGRTSGAARRRGAARAERRRSQRRSGRLHLEGDVRLICLLAHVNMLGSRCPTHSGASEGSGRREGRDLPASQHMFSAGRLRAGATAPGFSRP